MCLRSRGSEHERREAMVLYALLTALTPRNLIMSYNKKLVHMLVACMLSLLIDFTTILQSAETTVQPPKQVKKKNTTH